MTIGVPAFVQVTAAFLAGVAATVADVIVVAVAVAGAAASAAALAAASVSAAFVVSAVVADPVLDVDVEACYDLFEENRCLAAECSPHFVMAKNYCLPFGNCLQDSVAKTQKQPAETSSVNFLVLIPNSNQAALGSSCFVVLLILKKLEENYAAYCSYCSAAPEPQNLACSQNVVGD